MSTINAAFNVELKYYRATSQANAGKYALRANDRAVTLPSSVAGSVLGVTGLDNAAPVQMWVRPGVPARRREPGAGGQADRVPLLVVLRPALRAAPAEAGRLDQLARRWSAATARASCAAPTATTGTTSARA